MLSADALLILVLIAGVAGMIDAIAGGGGLLAPGRTLVLPRRRFWQRLAVPLVAALLLAILAVPQLRSQLAV